MTPLPTPCAFDCDCTAIREILDVLTAAGAGTWQLRERDSTWYPDYLEGKLAQGVGALLIDGVPSTIGMAEGQTRMIEENLKAMREGRPRPHDFNDLNEGRFKLEVTAKAGVSQEEVERLVRGALEKLNARNISGTSSDWFVWS
jgi:hypothetical protein